MRIIGKGDIVISKGTNKLVEEQRWLKQKKIAKYSSQRIFHCYKIISYISVYFKGARERTENKCIVFLL